jgi:2-phospho-L-lactate guanylyltransferase (CobY/MobA/RfbA family)
MWLPLLLEFDEKEVVAEPGLGDRNRVASAMLVDQTHLAIIGVARSIGVVTQRQEVRESGHGLIGMLVIDGIHILTRRGSNGRR